MIVVGAVFCGGVEMVGTVYETKTYLLCFELFVGCFAIARCINMLLLIRGCVCRGRPVNASACIFFFSEGEAEESVAVWWAAGKCSPHSRNVCTNPHNDQNDSFMFPVYILMLFTILNVTIILLLSLLLYKIPPLPASIEMSSYSP